MQPAPWALLPEIHHNAALAAAAANPTQTLVLVPKVPSIRLPLSLNLPPPFPQRSSFSARHAGFRVQTLSPPTPHLHERQLHHTTEQGPNSGSCVKTGIHSPRRTCRSGIAPSTHPSELRASWYRVLGSASMPLSTKTPTRLATPSAAAPSFVPSDASENCHGSFLATFSEGGAMACAPRHGQKEQFPLFESGFQNSAASNGVCLSCKTHILNFEAPGDWNLALRHSTDFRPLAGARSPF
jgi:hypothetical protein